MHPKPDTRKTNRSPSGTDSRSQAVLPKSKQTIALDSFDSMDSASRLERLEQVRSEFDHLENCSQWLEFLSGYLARQMASLSTPEAKLVMRILEHLETPVPELETILLKTLNDVPNLIGQKMGVLGACGSASSLDVLVLWDFTVADTPFIRNQLRKSINRLQRRLASSAEIDPSKIEPTQKMRLALKCIEGMEVILADSIARLLPSQLMVVSAVQGSGEVVCQTIRGAFQFKELLKLRLFTEVRLFLTRKIQLEAKLSGPGAEELLATIKSGGLSGIAESATQGAIRFSVRFEGEIRPSGSLLAHFAGKLEETLNTGQHSARWVNDPREEDWQFWIQVFPNEIRISLKLNSKHWDNRFAYRTKDLPAASHPTIAAMLAACVSKFAEPSRVIDPFCGTGLELIETGLLHPQYHLIAGDIDPDALKIAKTLARNAGVRLEKAETKDALSWDEKKLDCVITNPPFGRRAKTEDIIELLDRFLRKLPNWLKLGGQLVWISPQPNRTRQTLQQLGFVMERCQPMNLGGIKVELQVALFQGKR